MADTVNRPKKRTSVATRTMRSTVLSCVVMAVIAMAIGLSIYGSSLSQKYISLAGDIADSASLSVKHGQPRS